MGENENDAEKEKTRLETIFGREDMERLEWLQLATGDSYAGILRSGVRFMERLYKKFGL